MPISAVSLRRSIGLTTIAFILASSPAFARPLSQLLRPAPIVPTTPYQVAPMENPGKFSDDRSFGTGSRNLMTEQSIVLNRVIEGLMDDVLQNDPNTAMVNQSSEHYRKILPRLIAKAKESANFSVPYKGFGPSSEAGDVITNEKLKLKSQASAEYARQMHIDELHKQVVASVMQIATGLGMSDKARGRQVVCTEQNELATAVGPDEAKRAVNILSSWSRNLRIPEAVYNQEPWDVAQSQARYKDVFLTAVSQDPVIAEVMWRVHKYNHRSKFARTSAHVVETTLGLVAMAPDFIGAGGKVALNLFVSATGGPEMEKVLKELYLDKRFESRYDTLKEEAHMALENYQTAMLTHNPALLACSESVIEQLAGSQVVAQDFGGSTVQPATTMARPGYRRS
jgi:hypothetical protein